MVVWKEPVSTTLERELVAPELLMERRPLVVHLWEVPEVLVDLLPLAVKKTMPSVVVKGKHLDYASRLVELALVCPVENLSSEALSLVIHHLLLVYNHCCNRPSYSIPSGTLFLISGVALEQDNCSHHPLPVLEACCHRIVDLYHQNS